MATVGMLVDVKFLWTTVRMSSSSMDELSLTSAKQSMQIQLAFILTASSQSSIPLLTVKFELWVTLAAMTTHLVINSPRPHCPWSLACAWFVPSSAHLALGLAFFCSSDARIWLRDRFQVSRNALRPWCSYVFWILWYLSHLNYVGMVGDNFLDTQIIHTPTDTSQQTDYFMADTFLGPLTRLH